MRFAENNRISHRQLYRQILLVFVSPFFLCLFKDGQMLGTDGIAGVCAAGIILGFYVIFLIRLTPVCTDPGKNVGKIPAYAVGAFFLIYIILTAGFILELLEEIVPVSLVSGISGKWLSFLAAAVCSAGIGKGMQRRGRIAEVSGGIFAGGLILMMAVCAGQGRLDWLGEMPVTDVGDAGSYVQDTYQMICAFSGMGLLPFALSQVEKPGTSKKALSGGILTVCAMMVGMQILLPGVFGWNRLQSEKFPVLPLMDGADLPGNVLARFDVIWMGILIYGLLFSLGSLFHYGEQVAKRCGFYTGRYWVPVLGYMVSVADTGRGGIEDHYQDYLAYIFVPGMLLIQLVLAGKSRGKISAGKVRAAVFPALVLAAGIFMAGCAAVEPEKRFYPLAIGADYTEEGFCLSYSMPDLTETTGQEKPDDREKEILMLSGTDFDMILEKYNQSQDKYLDMGHLEVMILGDSLITSGKWREFMDYLKEQVHAGEDLYVFYSSDAASVLRWKGAAGSSVGEYLEGIQENRISGQQKKGVTLREIYHQMYKDNSLPQLPVIRLEDDLLYVDY